MSRADVKKNGKSGALPARAAEAAGQASRSNFSRTLQVDLEKYDPAGLAAKKLVCPDQFLRI